jgi:hypothetical protein
MGRWHHIIIGIAGVAFFSTSAPWELEIGLLLFRPGVETPGFMPVPLRGGIQIPSMISQFHHSMYQDLLAGHFFASQKILHGVA